MLGETEEAAALARAARRAAPKIALTAAVNEARARAFGEVGREDFPAAARRGGVKSAEGLLTALKWDRYRAVIDASHPFDARTSADAQAATRALGLPLLQLRRPLWPEGPGRFRAESAAEAAYRAPFHARCFLWIGLERLAPFARRLELWALTRAFEPPAGRYPLARGDYAVGRGPFTEAHERMLLSDYRIGWVALENSGSTLGAPTLRAAEALSLPVALIDPPEPPAPGPLGARVDDVAAALDWAAGL